MSNLWYETKKIPPPKDRDFLARCSKNDTWVARWYSEDNPHHINNKTGYNSVICDCCETAFYNEGTYWAEIPSICSDE